MGTTRASRFALLAIAGFVGAGPAFSCVNTFESNILAYKSAGDSKSVDEEIAKLELAYQKDASLENLNDLAVGRILTDRYPDAIKLLEQAEARFPGKAIVAANIGTAYELSGENEKALRWISEGVRRDPTEHRGSEWLHVKILEAKLALARDPRWLETNSVLGVSFGDADLPVMPASLPVDANGEPRSAVAVVDAISYQLTERTKFVNPPDALVADLYAAKGDMIYAIGKPANLDQFLGEPTEFYADALSYGPTNAQLVERRKSHFEAAYPQRIWMRDVLETKSAPGKPRHFAMIAAVIAAFAGVLFFWRRRLRRP